MSPRCDLQPQSHEPAREPGLWVSAADTVMAREEHTVLLFKVRGMSTGGQLAWQQQGGHGRQWGEMPRGGPGPREQAPFPGVSCVSEASSTPGCSSGGLRGLLGYTRLAKGSTALGKQARDRTVKTDVQFALRNHFRAFWGRWTWAVGEGAEAI